MKRKTALTVREITLIPCFSALIAACSLITVPMPGVPFTMQIFGVFFALACLGGRNGTIAVALYLALGAIGLPIFSGFEGGIAKLIGPTGGYLTGFLLAGPCYQLVTALFAKQGARPALWAKAIALAAGLLLCYLFGTLWFYAVWTAGGKSIGIGGVLALCVLPFLPFDLLKTALALALSAMIDRRGIPKAFFRGRGKEADRGADRADKPTGNGDGDKP